jgi:hypothetical protein
MSETAITRERKQPAESHDRYRCEEVLRALRAIKYGSLEIVVHGSEVVQIIRKEKVRFDAPAES